MRLLDRLVQGDPGETRYGMDWYANLFKYDGHQYNLNGTMPGSDPTVSDGTFGANIARLHNSNPVISGVVMRRAFVLSQVQFRWRWDDGTPNAGQLDLGPAVNVSNRPELLMRFEMDASYAGNAYAAWIGTGRYRRIGRLAPDRCTFLFGSNTDPGWNAGEPTLPHDAEVLALIYNPNTNQHDKTNLTVFFPGEFAHWMPEPDPEHWWRGASWTTSLLQDVALDGQISDHQTKFFKHAATPNLVFVMDPAKTPDEVTAYAATVNKKHAGSQNAWRNMFLGGGQDVKRVGTDTDIGFKDLQGGLETRMALRGLIPGVVLGVREGYAGQSLASGNYPASRRLWGDIFFSPYVDGLTSALSVLQPAPQGKSLSYDPTKILFLQEDQKDAAEILQTQLNASMSGVNAGYDPDAVIEALVANDIGKLKGNHTGLVSVQMQPPGEGDETNNTDLALTEVRARMDQLPELLRNLENRGSPVTIQNAIPEVSVRLHADKAIEVPPAQVTVNVPEARELPAPQVTVNVPEARELPPPVVNVNVEPTPITVLPAELPPPVVNVETPLKDTTFRRDQTGNITGATEKYKKR